MKNLLKGLVKFPIFLFFVVISFFLLSSKSFNVLGQENTESVWADVEGVIKVTDYDENLLEKDNLLFVSSECEGCSELISDFEESGVTPVEVNLLDITENTEFKTLLKEVYDSCTDIDVEMGTPFFYSEGTCYAGSVAIQERITSLQISLKENVLVNEEFDFLDAYKTKLAVEDFIEKSVTDLVLDSTQIWEWIVLAITLILAIAFLVYWIVKRKDVSRKKRVIFGILQAALFLLPTFYLGFKVNTAVNLGNEYSSAGNCNPVDGTGCVSWAEREAARASSDDYRLAHPKEAKRAKDFIDANGGAAAAIAAGNAQVKLASQALLEASKDKNGNINWDKAKNVASKIKSSSSGTISVDNNSKKQVITIGEVQLDVTAANLINPKAVYVAQVKNALDQSGSDLTCETFEYCQTMLVSLNAKTIANFKEKGTGGNVFQISATTGELVITPVNTAIIDGYCESTVKIDGVGSTSGILCNCENGLGGSAYTRSISGASCEAVCAVRFPCPDCNPPEPPPPDVPPSGGPYCGDGILGNTDGEECEYGDPNGVTCSWNNCDSSCKCPDSPEPYCGDGIINNDYEECELGDPDGLTCSWDNCNHVLCKCVEPGCGDGVLDEGESCERGDPDGFVCLWDTECNQLECSCKVETLPTCGDGVLDSGEYCEQGNPDGVSCQWDVCSKATCTCPSPKASIFDDTQQKMLLGLVLIVLGFLLTPFTKLLSNYYMKIGNGMVRFGKKIEKERIEKFENKVLRKK